MKINKLLLALLFLLTFPTSSYCIVAASGGGVSVFDLPSKSIENTALIKYPNNPIIIPTEAWEGTQIQDGCVIKEGNTFYRFYVAGSGGYDGSGRGNIAYATSSNGSYPYDWEKQNFSLASTSEEIFCASPRVFKLQDGSWRMYYQTYTTSLGTVAGYYATATAIAFPVFTRGARIFIRNIEYDYESEMVQPQCYIPPWESHDGSWHLLYSGWDGVNWVTCHATSSDGLSWTKDVANNPVMTLGQAGDWDAYDALALGWIYHAGKYYVFYQGKKSQFEHADPEYSIWRVGYATTEDFVTFIKFSDPILSETPANAYETPYYGNEGVDVYYDSNRNAIDLFYLMSQVSNESQGGYAYRVGVGSWFLNMGRITVK